MSERISDERIAEINDLLQKASNERGSVRFTGEGVVISPFGDAIRRLPEYDHAATITAIRALPSHAPVNYEIHVLHDGTVIHRDGLDGWWVSRPGDHPEPVWVDRVHPDVPRPVGPSRVVDREGQGWYLAGKSGGGTTWQASYWFNRNLTDVPDLEALAAERGPLRPVLPVTDADGETIEAQLRQAGRKGITTLAAALAATYQGLTVRLRNPSDSRRLILAGREGSWESECLMQVVYIGHDFNPKRVNAEAQAVLAGLFTTWVTGPDRFTEVAETLAGIVSRYADREHGPDGWRRIADQWIQSTSLAHDDFSDVYRWLYSQSEHYDSSLT